MSGDYSTVLGGGFNTVSGLYSNAVAGQLVSVHGDYSVAAGYDMTVDEECTYCVIGGGYYNSVSAEGVTVGGGFYNTVNMDGAVISGGYYGKALGYASCLLYTSPSPRDS